MLASVITGHFLELLTLFAIVFIHEWGHVAAAKWFGVHVLSVQLLPFGGVAVMEDTAYLNAGREMMIALAGPLQNGLLIGCAWLLHAAGLWDGPYYDYFVQGNVLIALFNLLPVLPLDGGRYSSRSAVLFCRTIWRSSGRCASACCSAFCLSDMRCILCSHRAECFS